MGYRLGEWEKPPLDELMHYGVPGMKWGHHKRVDSVEIATARSNFGKTKEKLDAEIKRNRKETLYGLLGPTSESLKKIEIAEREHRYSKEDLTSAKILTRLKSKPKSETQLKLEEKYKEKRHE